VTAVDDGSGVAAVFEREMIDLLLFELQFPQALDLQVAIPREG
jgi:hypothetical protein